MRLIPKNQNEWRNLLRILCKAYIVLAYAIWKSISIFIYGENSSFIPPAALTVGYLFCILVLSFVAGRQVERKENKSAVWTFIFLMIGLAWYHNRLHNGGIYAIEQWLIQMLLLGSVLAIVFWGMGIVLIVRRLQNQPVRVV